MPMLTASARRTFHDGVVAVARPSGQSRIAVIAINRAGARHSGQ
jgi:hypothetical protein